MVTPRRRITTKPEPPEVNEQGEIMANVNETIIDGENTKELNYVAPLNEIKGDTKNSESFNGQPEINYSDFEDFSEREVFEEIPKSKLDKMFDNLLEVDPQGYQSFYAQIVRLPDAMSDNFALRSQSQMPLGTQIFSIRDRFIFIPAIQKLNSNSGGRFNILVLDENGKEVTLERIYNFNTIYHSIGLANLVIPNPIIEAKTENNNNQNNNNSNDDRLLAFMQQSQNQFNSLLSKMSEKPEPSLLEKALEAKMINDLTNPPTPQNSFEDMLKTVVAAPVFAEKLTSKMFPDNPTPAEAKKWYENVLESDKFQDKVLDIFGGVINAGVNYVETKAFVNLTPEQQDKIKQQNAEMETESYEPEQPAPLELSPEQIEQQEKQQASMNNLIGKIVTELESENKIDGKNKLIKELSAEFKDEFSFLKMACLTMSFDSIMVRIASSAPEVIKPYLDPAFFNETGQIIAVPNKDNTENVLMFSESGQRMKGRLFEIFNLLKG